MRAAARGRRLSDKIRTAFHTACDDEAFEIAQRLLNQLDELTRRPPILPTGVDRRQPESLAALDERLANLLLWRTESGQLMMAADRKFAAQKSYRSGLGALEGHPSSGGRHVPPKDRRHSRLPRPDL
jgi:hypothetical protein